MGSARSTHYARFKNFCFTAFTILRKTADLIFNLVALMDHGGREHSRHQAPRRAWTDPGEVPVGLDGGGYQAL
ncbi:hypothetical protein EDB19DRAFT_1749247 [Suillus lakei]|nr:hypothetical protein EDB19DRAFT_1749247 [Suillus lakei]